MKTYIADTNIFLRFLLKDIPHRFEESRRFLLKAKRNEAAIIVPQIVIFEIQFALSKAYGFEKKEIIDKLESLLSIDFLHVESRDVFIRAISIHKDRNSLSFVDCFLRAKSDQEGAELFTFDKKLKNLKTS